MMTKYVNLHLAVVLLITSAIIVQMNPNTESIAVFNRRSKIYTNGYIADHPPENTVDEDPNTYVLTKHSNNGYLVFAADKSYEFVSFSIYLQSNTVVKVFYGDVFRGGCSKQRTVELLDHFRYCKTVSGIRKKYVSCGRPAARFAALRVTNASSIALREFQVYGLPSSNPKPFKKPTCAYAILNVNSRIFTSPYEPTHPPKNAVDRNLKTYVLTKYNSDAYLVADLSRSHYFEKITIYFDKAIALKIYYGDIFRGDCDQKKALEFLDKFTYCTKVNGIKHRYIVTCGTPSARYVALRVTKASVIAIRLIQVYGVPNVDWMPERKPSCAFMLLSPKTQFYTNGYVDNFTPTNAVDRDPETYLLTEKSSHAYLVADFKVLHDFERMSFNIKESFSGTVLFGSAFRGDCSDKRIQEQLEDFSYCTDIDGSGDKEALCGKRTARFVALRVKGVARIALREIQVFGTLTKNPKPLPQPSCALAILNSRSKVYSSKYSPQHPPNYAVDQDSKTYAMTKKSPRGYFIVENDKPFVFEKIIIVFEKKIDAQVLYGDAFRDDCGSRKTNEFMKEFKFCANVAGIGEKYVTCGTPTARFVAVMVKWSASIAIKEIQIMGVIASEKAKPKPICIKKTYKIVKDTIAYIKSYSGWQNVCKKEGGHLARIESRLDMGKLRAALLKIQVKKIILDYRMKVGGKDFYDSANQKLPKAMWSTVQPKIMEGVTNCVVMPGMYYYNFGSLTTSLCRSPAAACQIDSRF